MHRGRIASDSGILFGRRWSPGAGFQMSRVYRSLGERGRVGKNGPFCANPFHVVP
ncbi:hypothetical protein Z947_1030 [Sulfitobacter geojensis]|nr:hypothetical protein Z947_1030 [Sulfitobacter geojensis]